MMTRLSIALLMLSAVGCSTAGPFVTNISNDGNDSLDIEKCMVQMNGWTGTVSNVECRASKIRIGADPSRRSASAK